VGSRANLIVTEQGETTIHYSHWGAQYIPSLLVSGHEKTLAYIADFAPVEDLIEIGWAEGGVLLDSDARRLTFWGGDSILHSPYLRRLLLPGLRRIWPGWDVAWATHGPEDFALYLGRDPASVISPYAPPPVVATSEQLRGPQRPELFCVVTVKWEDRQITDHGFSMDPDRALLFGVGLLEIVRDATPDALPHEASDSPNVHGPEGGAYLDLATHTLWAWEDNIITFDYLRRIEQVWPGWHAKGHVDGLARQVALSGRDPALVMPPIDQVIAELADELSYGVEYAFEDDAPEVAAAAAAREAAERFAPGFFSLERWPTSREEYRTQLTHFFHKVARDQEIIPTAE